MAIYNEFGYITIDDARIDETCNAYFKWKDLNTYISNNSQNRQLKTAAQTGAAGQDYFLCCDGTNRLQLPLNRNIQDS